MITISRKNRKPNIIKEADTVKEAVEYAVKNRISLEGADLHNADLMEADLNAADLKGADLSNADMAGADLNKANLIYATLSGGMLTCANLFHANLSCADLRGADLSNADLYYANLSNSDVRGADLSRANLSGADIDYSCLPLWCGSLNMKIDKRIFCQLLYHVLRAGKSVKDEEVVAFLGDQKALALANQFHRVEECGKI